MLLIYSASVDALNRDIQDRGERPVDESAFRANVSLRPSLARDEAGSVEHSDMLRPFAEDSWTSLRIGPHTFTMLGACRRCQMVCVDQATAEKRQEPYVTLAKTRRFDGKVFFGCHMRHEPVGVAPSGETQYPTIQVGDLVTVEDGRD